MKATAVAPSNIAFIKYWGKKDEATKLPANGSLSMNLSNLLTTTTVEFAADIEADECKIDGETYSPETKPAQRILKHIDRIRNMANLFHKVRIHSTNNFPSGTGLSSSASGFAALTVAGATAAGLKLTEKELSILARKGSGSACRSIPDGFVEWLDGSKDEDSYAVSVHSPEYWDIADVVAVISKNKKEISSTTGQELATTSPFYSTRLSLIGKKLQNAKRLIENKDFMAFGELIEGEALELHCIMLTSTPSLVYWQPETVTLMKTVHQLRRDGLPVFFTLNTGQDIHLICQKKDIDLLNSELKRIPQVMKVINNSPAPGTKVISEHLF